MIRFLSRYLCNAEMQSDDNYNFADFSQVYSSRVFHYKISIFLILTAEICAKVMLRYRLPIFKHNKRHSVKTVSSEDRIIYLLTCTNRLMIERFETNLFSSILSLTILCQLQTANSLSHRQIRRRNN